MKNTLVIVIVLVLLGTSARAAENLTAILSAFDAEAQHILAAVEHAEHHDVQGIRFTTGTLQGRPVVVALVGVGKVNAAMSTAICLMQFSPSEVIFSGIAGALRDDLQPGDIVIATQTIQHDYGKVSDDGSTTWRTWNVVTGKQNPLAFPADERLLALATRVAEHVELTPPSDSDDAAPPQVVQGVIVTGDVFVASPSKSAALRQKLDAAAVEMEGAAVAQVCYQLNVPCLVVRAVSDSANSTASDDFDRYFKLASDNAAKITMAIVAELAAASVEVAAE